VARKTTRQYPDMIAEEDVF